MMPSAYVAQNSIIIKTYSGKREVSIRNSRKDFKIEYEGEILLSDGGKDIKNISSGGFLEIKKSSFGRSQKIVIEKEGNTLVRKFYIGWTEKDYYLFGKNWLHAFLP
jgi:hypothetical protein